MGTNYFPTGVAVQVGLTDEFGNAVLAKGTVANKPSAVAGYAKGCDYFATDTGAHYYNTGTATSCTFTLVGTVTAGSVDTAELADAGVTLAKLASGITPSHVVKFAGTASGGTTATRAYTVTGAVAGDVATAVIRASTNAASIQKATLSTDTLTVLFSTDPGASTTVDYTVLRAAA